MTCMLYTFLRFTRQPPSLEIIFDRIRDESRSCTTSAHRIGSEFQLVFTGSVSVFKNGIVCWWQCWSYFYFLLVVNSVACHVLYKFCLKMYFMVFFLNLYEYLKLKYLYLTCMRKMIVFNNPFLIYVFVGIFCKNNMNSNFSYKDKSSVCFLSVVLSVVLCLYRICLNKR